jgi:hypothetical protein
MARQTLEKLIQGDYEIVESFIAVKKMWDEIVKSFEWNDSDALNKMSRILSNKQIAMEVAAGERWLGQEIMVIVGIGQFYSTRIGFDTNFKKAKLVRDAFLISYCSLEVKGLAEEIGELYSVNDYNYENI